MKNAACRKTGKKASATHLYIDEFHVVFENSYTMQFFSFSVAADSESATPIQPALLRILSSCWSPSRAGQYASLTANLVWMNNQSAQTAPSFLLRGVEHLR
jgi:hypothetical protein